MPLNIKPIDKNIRDLLSSGRQFIIPRFQREYSWDKKNYQEFLNDILKGLEIKDGGIVPSPYFVGTMLFVGNFTDNSKSVIQVVDGQQRLTTITILFSALSDIFKQNNEDSLSKTIFRYIMSEDDDGNEVRIIKTKTSYPYFAYYIQDRSKENVDEEPATEEEINIKQTFDFFISRLSEKYLRTYLSKRLPECVNDLSYIDILKAIRDQVLGCTFVSISTDEYDQAYRIFEILNAKGKKLQFNDLIKNKLFEVLDTQEPADYAEEKWRAIKGTLESAGDASVGMATFFRHFWSSMYGQSGANRLYDDFMKKVPNNESSYKNFMQDMLVNAKYYTDILRPTRERYNNKKQYFWLVQSLTALSNYFGVSQTRVVLMPLLMARDNGLINMNILKSTVLFLENFHFAYTAIMSGMSNRLDKIYSKFAVSLRTCSCTEDCKLAIERDLIGELKPLLPSFEQFKDKFVKLTYTKKNTASNLKSKYVVNKLNAFYSGKELFDDSLSVEHILPESTSDASLNIGNLIALEMDLNGSVSSEPYIVKKREYLKSEYIWVKSFVNKYDIWDASCIEGRASEMADIYYREILKF